MSLLNQMEFIAGNRECRSGFFNKNIFEFLRMIYNQKDEYGADTNPDMIRIRERLFSFVSKISALCVPGCLTYNMRYFIVDMLVACLNKSKSELATFESLLGLTQFASEDDTLALKLYTQLKIMGNLMSSMCDENPHISNASYELMSNIVMCEPVLNDIAEGKPIRANLKRAFYLINLYLAANRQTNGGKITQLAHADLTQKFPTGVNILCVVCCVPGLPEELLLELERENVLEFLKVIEDKEILKALNFKFKYVVENMIAGEGDEKSGPVLKETGAELKCKDKEVLLKFKGNEIYLEKFLALCKNKN